MIVRLMTFHTPDNYGAVFQAYALQEILKSLARDVKIINYDTEGLRSGYPLVSVPRNIRGFVITCLQIMQINKRRKLKCGFQDFRKKYFDLTERFESFEQLLSNPPKADIYVTGSDQVFRPDRWESDRNAFYLKFSPKSIRTAAYAASFGVTKIHEAQKRIIETYLNRFDHLSTREDSGAIIVKELTGRMPEVVLDPVFLLSLPRWREMEIIRNSLPEKFVLLYSVISSRLTDLAAGNIAQKAGLPLIVISTGVLFRGKCKAVLRDVSPQQFLYIFDRASIVVTDAFHGVAFSLVFQKQFVFSDTNPVTKDRAMSLLNRIGQRNLMKDDNTNLMLDPIDYNEVSRSLDLLAVKSKEFLSDIIAK